MWAVTTTETDAAVYRIEDGHATKIASTLAFENTVDPAEDGTEEGSNPFDLARLTGGRVLVADAAGNSLLDVLPRRRRCDRGHRPPVRARRPPVRGAARRCGPARLRGRGRRGGLDPGLRRRDRRLRRGRLGDPDAHRDRVPWEHD